MRNLRIEDEESFRRAEIEFTAEEPGERFAFHFDETMIFANYVKWINLWPEGKGLPGNFVPNTFLLGVVGELIVGRVSIRHGLNDHLERIGGHIGYAVIPSQRNRGYATEMLRLSLPVAASVGIRRALLTCDSGNIASQRVIEKNGGVFEGFTDAPELSVQKRRYWIAAS